MSERLLDVNVLLALVDTKHIHYEPANRWFGRVRSDGWATCPITENAFVRILSRPSYPNSPGDVAVTLGMLGQLREVASHDFWADDISILDVLEPNRAITPSQLTDVYLLGLAVHHGGRLATLDRRIPMHAVRGGGEAIEFVPT